MVDVQKRVGNRLLPKKNLFWSMTMLTKESLCPNPISSLKSRVLDIVVDMVKRDVKNGVIHRLMPKKNLFWLMTMSTKENLCPKPISSLKSRVLGIVVDMVKKGCKKWCYTPAYAEEKPVLVDDNADKSKFVSEPDFKPEVESFRYCCRYGRNNRCEE